MVSIVVPIYNTERYLDRCIYSIVHQTIDDLEIILVNDGSTDGSLAVCEDWACADRRVKIYDLPNRGVSFSRNFGITQSSGEYIFMLDSDDWIAPNTLNTLLAVQQESQSDCVICGLNQTSGAVWAPIENKVYNSFQHFCADFPYWLNTELLSCSVNKLYKRELITSFYPENMSFAEDLVFCLNYLRNCDRISFISDPLYQHDVSNTNSLTHSFDIHRFEDVELMQAAILDFGKNCIDKHNLKTKYIKDIISVIRNYFKISNYSFEEKKQKITEWYYDSHLKTYKISDFISMKDKFIFLLLKTKNYGILNLLWNRQVRSL